MLAYECIFPYYDERQRRGRCWLRLYQRSALTVAIASEVPGNTGATIPDAIQYLGNALIDRFGLNARRTTLISHYPPDSEYTMRGEYSKVLIMWLGSHFAYPEWRPLSAQDVQGLVGERVSSRLPFWQPQGETGWYQCAVGQRQGVIHRAGDETWQAMVQDKNTSSYIQGGFACKLEAQAWVLNELAWLAAEYDVEYSEALRR